MPTPPPCKKLGRYCRELEVTVRISDLDDDSLTLQDAASTWLTGHTERITWGNPYTSDRLLLVDAVIHVPCTYLRSENGGSGAQCAAHRFTGAMPTSTRPAPEDRQKLQYGNNRFSVIHRKRRTLLAMVPEEPDDRSLPVIQPEENPCASAQCRTSDNKIGAACCRDLTLELDLPRLKTRLEALIRSRKSPYLCKVTRDDEETLECEVISACGYLDHEDHVSCTMHGLLRPNGKTAKPGLCSEWPELDEDETGHPGCVFCDED